ncbi:MAG: hypothetical protein HY809_04225 [Nitrospirae bacterium]|nr:hypothetical protein [Nitrospirota bacterium]
MFHIPPDASEEITALMAMAGKICILLGCAKIAIYVLVTKRRSSDLSILGRIKSRFSKYYVPKRIRRE